MQSTSAAKDARRRGHNRAKRARKHHAAARRRAEAEAERFRIDPDGEYMRMADAVIDRENAWWRRLLRTLRRLWPW